MASIFLACDMRGTNSNMIIADLFLVIALVIATRTISHLTLKLDFSVSAIFLGYYVFCIGDLMQNG